MRILHRNQGKIGNPLEWNSAEKANLLLGIFLILQVMYLALIYSLIHLDSLRPYANLQQAQRHLPLFQYLLLTSIAVNLVIYAARQRWSDHPLYEHIACQYFAISHIYYGYCVGILSLPVGTVMAGAPVVGFIFFHRTAVALASLVSLTLILSIAFLSTNGTLMYAPLIPSINTVDNIVPTPVLATYLLISLPHYFFLFGLAFYVLQRWRKREAEVRYLSRTDSLTGLLNRGSIMQHLEKEHIESEAKSSPLSVLMVDLDHFKKINDEYGHSVGDDALVKTAAALTAALRQHDYVGRYGGEEFLIVLPGLDGDDAKYLAERIREAIANISIYVEGRALKLSASLGLSYYSRTHRMDKEALLKAADAALYEAKNAGRDRLVISA